MIPQKTNKAPNTRVPSGKKRRPHKSNGKSKVGSIILKVLAFILITVLAIALLAYFGLGMLMSDSNPEIQSMTVTTFLETGAFKFIPHLYLSDSEIQKIVDGNKMKDMDADVDEGLINLEGIVYEGTLNVSTSTSAESDDSQNNSSAPIEIHEVSGSTYYGTMMIVKDPSRVSLATIYPWRDLGVTLDQLVKDNGAVAGINGGLYNSYNNTGGSPYGVIVSNGQIQYNQPQQWPGLVLVGFTENNILQIIDISQMTPKQVEQLVKDRKIRDAVTFQDEASDANNHFVQLIINGEARELNGMGSGLNPRTAIGQRADGAVLMFVTDGRGKNGHLGASASDLIEVMRRFDAVNAANLDGGSSSCMYYGDEYLMTSVTFYNANSSWRLPAGFVVK